MGLPVAASSAINFQRALMKIRRCVGDAQVATPRCTKPVPFDGCPVRHISGSNFHNSRPVRASSAATAAYGVETYMVSPSTIGDA